MREILFRGKRVDNDEWAQGYLMDENYINVPFNDDEACGRFDDPVEIDPETVGQYTELKDTNGNKIFEGDILRVTDDEGCTGIVNTGKGEVEFFQGLWYICGRVQNGLYDIVTNYQTEIIRNIHDNPELLVENIEEVQNE